MEGKLEGYFCELKRIGITLKNMTGNVRKL